MASQDLPPGPAELIDPSLTAADVMTAAPRTCSNFSSVLEAVMIFRDANCGFVPVLQDGKPVGVLTDRDVALGLTAYPDLLARPVTDVMSRDLVTVPPDATLQLVTERLGDEGVSRILVVEDDQLLGVISWIDLVPHLTERGLGRVLADIVRVRS